MIVLFMGRYIYVMHVLFMGRYICMMHLCRLLGYGSDKVWLNVNYVGVQVRTLQKHTWMRWWMQLQVPSTSPCSSPCLVTSSMAQTLKMSSKMPLPVSMRKEKVEIESTSFVSVCVCFWCRGVCVLLLLFCFGGYNIFARFIYIIWKVEWWPFKDVKN